MINKRKTQIIITKERKPQLLPSKHHGLTWANKTVSFDPRDNKATTIDMDGMNDCDIVLPSIPVHANGKPTSKMATSRAFGESRPTMLPPCFFSLIHSGHFYSAPSSPLLLRGAPDYSTDTVSEFHAEAHRQL